ncbi:MAG: POTRA domain-containing protein [Candidatus Puniceispirillales bacterium]
MSGTGLAVAAALLMVSPAAEASVDCIPDDPAQSVPTESIDLMLIESIQENVVYCTPQPTRPELKLAGGVDGFLETIIGEVSIDGKAVENEVLAARFTVNRPAMRALQVRTRLEWRRDGEPLSNTDESRYRLGDDDIGHKLSVKVELIDSKDRVILTRLSGETDRIIMMEHLPVISNLALSGLGLPGENLKVTYDFSDKNPEDTEEGTVITWLRNNRAISHAVGSNYLLAEADVGTAIAVMVTPRSSDGIMGEPVVANFDGTIEPLMVEVVPEPEPEPEDLVEPAPVLVEKKAIEPIITVTPPAATAAPEDDAVADQATGDLAALDLAEDPEPETQLETQLEDDLAVVTEEEQTLPEAGAEPLAEEAEDLALLVVPEETVAPEPEEVIPGWRLATEGDEIPPDDDVETPLLRYQPEPGETPYDGELIALAEGLDLAVQQSGVLRRINFSETEILAERDLKAINDRYFKQPITLGMIRSILDDTNALYTEAGYALSRALLPEQTIYNGVVSIQLVEARVGKIVVENNRMVKETYIRRSLGFKSGDLIKLSRLENKIRRYNANNKSTLISELAPGEGFGETDVFLKVEEPDSFELPSVSVNNHGSELSDWRQNTFTTVFNNIFGYDDELSVSFADSEGSTTKSFQLSFPFDEFGTNVTLARSMTDTKIKSGPDTTVGYRGSSHSNSIGISRPMVFNDRYSIYLSAVFAHGYGDLVQPGDAAVLLSRSHTRKFALSTPMSWSDGVTTLSFSPMVSVINAVTEIPRSEDWMAKVEGDAAISRFITAYLTGNMRGKFLYTEHSSFINLPSEILSVGGPGSVRAYQPGEDSGYQGYFLTAELRTDMANWDWRKLPDFMPNVQPYVFIDHMFAQKQYGRRNRADYWSGFGVGVTVPIIADIFTFDSYWAKSLDADAHKQEKDAYDDNVIKFALSAKLKLN